MSQEKFSSVLPEDFDGTFRFSNPYDEDFLGKWDSKLYLFPAHTRSPIIIPTASPLEIQQIRKKFARDLAEREFFKSQKAKDLTSIERGVGGVAVLNSIEGANSYSDSDLEPFIQKCLDPLPPVVEAKVAEAPKVDVMDKLSRDDATGEPRTQVYDQKVSLKEKALKA